MFAMAPQQRESLRRSLLDNYRQLGAPSDEAALIVDMALHAVDSAIRTVEECCDRLPHNQIGAMALAFGVLQGMCESAEEAIRVGMVGQPGVKSADIVVEVGGAS